MRFLSSAQLLFKQLSRERRLLSSIAGELEDMKLLCAAPLVNKLRDDFVLYNIQDAEFKVFYNLATMESFSISSTVWRFRLPNADSLNSEWRIIGSQTQDFCC